MSQHILHQNPIPSRRILNKNVRDCSDEFSVLDDGAAAHALDDPAGQGQKFRIGYANDHVLVVAVGGVVYFLNLNLVVFQFPGHAAADAGTAFSDGNRSELQGSLPGLKSADLPSRKCPDPY